MAEVDQETGASHARPVYTKVAIAGLLLLALPPLLGIIGYAIASSIALLTATILAFVVILIVAGVVWQYGSRRWALIVAVIFAVLGLLANLHVVPYGLSNPDSFFDFAPAVILIAGFLLAFVGGIVALVQRGRTDPRTAATGAEMGTFGIIAVALVALAIVSGILTATGGSSVSAEDRAGAIELVMKNVRFEPDRLEIPSAEAVRLVIKNDDLLVHTFTVDELGIDTAMGPGSEILIDLPRIVSGALIYTCEVPGHEDMKGTLVAVAP